MTAEFEDKHVSAVTPPRR